MASPFAMPTAEPQRAAGDRGRTAAGSRLLDRAGQQRRAGHSDDEGRGLLAFGSRGLNVPPKKERLERTEVRFHKKAEEEGASRIVEVLAAAGVDATLKYLRMEGNNKVRPNHFEIWFAGGVRNVRHRQAPAAQPPTGPVP